VLELLIKLGYNLFYKSSANRFVAKVQFFFLFLWVLEFGTQILKF
jgi:hypothetical protein